MVANTRSFLSGPQRALVTEYLNKTRTPQFTRVAEVLLDEGMLDECVHVLRAGLVDFPVLSSARLLLAKCLYLRGFFEEAESEIKILESTQPKNITLLKLKLRISVFYERKDSALLALRTLSDLVSEDNVMKKTKLGLALEEFSKVKSVLAEESSFLAKKLKAADGVSPMLEGDYQKCLETLKEMLSRETVVEVSDSSSEEQTVLSRVSFDAFVPVPTSAAARLQGNDSKDERVVFLKKLLNGLEQLG